MAVLLKRSKVNRLIFVIFIAWLFVTAAVLIEVPKNNSAPSENNKKTMAQTESWLNIEMGRIKRHKLDKLFDSQIQTLKSQNTPKQITAILENQRGIIIAKALAAYYKNEHINGHIPFLPIIPRASLSVDAQMRMVKNGKKTGRKINHYDHPVVVTDMFETPERPYYIFDVEDGTATLGKSPLDAQNLINKQGRRGLTEVEIISLAIHTDVLTRQMRHYLWAVGSRADEFADGTQDGVPSLDIADGRPELCWIEYVSTALFRGSPSSSKALVAINILF